MNPKRSLPVPAEASVLVPYVDAGVFEDADVQVAAAVSRVMGGVGDLVVLATALCVRGLRLGHICVGLDEVGSGVTIDVDNPSLVDLPPWPAGSAWVDAITASPAVQVIEALPDPESSEASDGNCEQQQRTTRPLVWDGSRLYLERYWRYESELANHLIDAAAPDKLSEPSQYVDITGVLDTLFGPDDTGGLGDIEGLDESDDQRRAVAVALTTRVAVMAGGPGTGKTYTVSRLVAAAHEVARGEGRSVEVALAAPTGKAATRMTDAVRGALSELSLSPEVGDLLAGVEATTIHRLLGATKGVQFRHGRDNPLPHDLVIVDEASMVDLPLMAKLVGALKPNAHLVLVGDPNQLASVEAGAVLGDVVAAGISDIVVLERRHRFQDDSAIARLADAVRVGDFNVALDTLRGAGPDELHWIDPSDHGALVELRDQLGQAAIEVVELANAGDVSGALTAAASQKVLCATRFGSLGTRGWTAGIEGYLDRSARSGRYVGKPVIITRNDYVTRVMNGDTGIIAVADDRLVLAIEGANGIRQVPLVQLDHLDAWWAMTIHKSQGSEFDHAVISLPDGDNPILTRELLYTGITRGKRKVTLVADRSALRSAIEQPIRRASGLRDRLATQARRNYAPGA